MLSECRPLINSAKSGFFFCGIMDEPVQTASSNEKNRFDSLEYSIISEASLLRTADSPLMYCTNCSSTHPRVSWDDVETTSGFAKPSFSASNSRSISMDVPKPAAEPNGHLFTRDSTPEAASICIDTISANPPAQSATLLSIAFRV